MKSTQQIGTRLLPAVLLSISLCAYGVNDPNDNAGASQINPTKSTATASSSTTDGAGMIYTTSRKWHGDLTAKKGGSGVSGADVKCQSDVKCPIGAKCKALIVARRERLACTPDGCGDGHNLDWVLKPNTRYVFDDNDGKIGITDVQAIFQPRVTQNFAGKSERWTGLKENWHTADLTCNSWTSSENTWTNYGNIDFFGGNRDCAIDSKYPIYCVVAPSSCDAEPKVGVNWIGCDKSNVDLSHKNLQNSYMRSASFANAILNGTILSNTKLDHVNFKGAHLAGAFLYGADLRYADLTDADLNATDLTKANLSGATWIDGSICNSKSTNGVCNH